MNLQSIVLVVCITALVGGCASTPDESAESDVLSTLGQSTTSPTDNNEALTVSDYLSAGDDALNAGDLDTAQVKYSLALSQNKKSADALYKLAQIHFLTGSYTIAQSLLERVLIEDSQSVGAYETLGLIFLKTENISDSEKSFNQALSIQPSRWRSLNGLGVIKDIQGQYSEAQMRFHEASLLTPNNVRVINNLGYSYYLQGNYADAQQFFLKATRADASYSKAWANLGLTFLRQRRYDDARAAFAKIVDPHVAANNLGYLSMLQGDLDTAHRELNRAVQVAPRYYELANENLSLLGQRGSTNQVFEESLADLSSTLGDANMIIIPASAKTDQIVRVPDTQVLDTDSIVKTELSNIEQINRETKVSLQRKTKRSQPLSDADYLLFLGYGELHGLDPRGSLVYNAVLSFQVNHGLQATGTIRRETREHLKSQTQQKLIEQLSAYGYLDGTGVSSEAKVGMAIRSFERENGLSADGLIDRKLLMHLSK